VDGYYGLTNLRYIGMGYYLSPRLLETWKGSPDGAGMILNLSFLIQKKKIKKN
jgi:hypothetical protein